MRYSVSAILFAFLAGLFFTGQALAQESDKKKGKDAVEMQQPYELGKDSGQQQAQDPLVNKQQPGGGVDFGGGNEVVVTRGQGNIRSEDVEVLQKRLKDRGYEVGPIDGLYGPQTDQALRKFHESQGIAVSGPGRINRETLKALDMDSEEFFGLSPKFQEDQKQKEMKDQQKMKKDAAGGPDVKKMERIAGQTSMEDIREIQRALNERGFSVGEPDGRIGPKTRQALRSFQESENLAVTGLPTQETLNALDVEIAGRIGESVGGPPELARGGQVGEMSTEQVKQIQQNLSERGFEVGGVDGIYGPKTQQALQEFQQSQGIAATGRPNEETLNSLGIEEQEFFGVSPKFEGDQKQENRMEKEMDQMKEKDKMQTPEKKY